MTSELAARLRARWHEVAFICRYASQDVYRILGRDPMHDPLTPLERAIFVRCIEEHVEAEFQARQVAGLTDRSEDD